MDKQQKIKEGQPDNGEEVRNDPSIRQEFPGAASNKGKVEAGKRDTSTSGAEGDKKVQPQHDKPESDGEEVNIVEEHPVQK